MGKIDKTMNSDDLSDMSFGLKRKRDKWTAPPKHVQDCLRQVLVANIDLINVNRLGRRVNAPAKVNNYVSKNAPIVNDELWRGLVSAVAEDVARLRAMCDELADVLTKIEGYESGIDG
jgi:hypothetical protein